MTTKTAGVTIPDTFILPAAAAVQGLMHASANGLINVALAFYQGMPREDALKYASGSGNLEKSGRIDAKVHMELAEVGENIGIAYAARVGLGMMMGMSRETAEKWARIPMGPKAKTDI